MSSLSGDARRAIVLAQEEMASAHHSKLTGVDFFLGTLRAASGKLSKLLWQTGVDEDKVRDCRVNQMPEPESESTAVFSTNAARMLQAAFDCANELGHHELCAAHILLAAMRNPDDELRDCLQRADVDCNAVAEKLVAYLPPIASPKKRAVAKLPVISTEALLEKIAGLTDALWKHRGLTLDENVKIELGHVLDAILYTCQRQRWDIESLFYVDPELDEQEIDA